MYGQGITAVAISRVLAVKPGTAYEWGKKARWALGIRVEVAMQGQRWSIAPAISFDGMWTYQWDRRGKKRREVWVWTAIALEHDGRCRVGFEIGDRSEAAFDRLYRRLPEGELYRTDAYGAYVLLPADRHIAGKGGAVNRNEGFHSWCRGKLNRLGRRTKGYAKSVAMLEYSLASLCGKWQQKSNSRLF